MANEIIKETAKGNGVKLWQIADKLGIYDGNFSRKLRHELAAEEQIRMAIYSISPSNWVSVDGQKSVYASVKLGQCKWWLSDCTMSNWVK